MTFSQNLSISISLILEEILNSPACKGYVLICSLIFLYVIVPYILIACVIYSFISYFFPSMLKSRILRIYMYTILFIMALSVPIQICEAIASAHMLTHGTRFSLPYFINNIVGRIVMALFLGWLIGPSKLRSIMIY